MLNIDLSYIAFIFICIIIGFILKYIIFNGIKLQPEYTFWVFIYFFLFNLFKLYFKQIVISIVKENIIFYYTRKKKVIIAWAEVLITFFSLYNILLL